jgi:OFA family oxalate/formate antiporter-like MFS transporter
LYCLLQITEYGERMNTVKNHGWRTTFAGLGINLALGTLYTWSIFKVAIYDSIAAGGPGSFDWNKASLNDPYATATLVFSLSMIIAGILQDRKGPRITALVGGILVAGGFIMISLTTSYAMWIIGFGLLVGSGIGFGYSASTPPALKWFPKSKSGLISGLVVSGFGLAPLFIAPLATVLLGAYGIQTTLLIFGLAFFVIVGGLSFLLKNPPAGFIPDEAAGSVNTASASTSASVVDDRSPAQMVKTPLFYLLWLLYFVGAGAGLMVIGSVAGLAKASLGDLAFIAVAIMAIGNAGGRVTAGILSDKIGGKVTLIVMLVFQALLMLLAIPLVQGESAVLLVILATFIGFNYGSNLSIFPGFAKAEFGMKNFGVNYGILFTAWGFGGFVMSRLSQSLVSATGNYNMSFTIAAVMLFAAAALAVFIRKPAGKSAA